MAFSLNRRRTRPQEGSTMFLPLAPKTSARRSRLARRPVRPMVEILEDRTVPTTGWVLPLEGAGGEPDLAVDSAGNSYVMGTFSGTIDLDPGPGTASVTSA